MYSQETLNLKTLENLNQQFERILPSVVQSLEDPAQKAGITIKIDFQLLEDSDRSLKVTTSVKPSFPSKARSLIAHRDLTGNLKADSYDLGIVELPAQSTLKTVDGKSINDTQEDD